MKLKKIILYICVLLSLTAIVGGGLFAGLNVNNSSDTTQEFIEDKNTSAATAPTNNSYWDESVSRVDTDWSGSGTQADPWLITSAAELAGLSYSIYNNTKSSYLSGVLYYTGKYFKQTADIDVSAYYWQPIGIYYNRSGVYTRGCFAGNYDGDGHIVSGVFTKSGSGYAFYYQGLFGYVNGSGSTKTTQATIKNLGIINSYIQGAECIGGIAGHCNNASISNSFNASDISGSYAVGGITGECSNNVSISNCYNIGNLKGTGVNTGGILGWATNNITINNCYSTGNVNGTDYVAGIVGGGFSSLPLVNCFNIGSISGTGRSGIAGVAGTWYVAYSYCYYGGNCTTSDEYAVLNTSLISNAKTLSWYTNTSNWDTSYNWDFENIWGINSKYNDGYPVFKWQIIETWNDYAADSYASGSGTSTDPYIITTPEQLAKVAVDSRSSTLSGKYYKMAADVDLSAHIWEGIGGFNSSGYRFSGVFDGDFYQIKNIKTAEGNYQAAEEVGLFSYVRNPCVIKNIIMKGGTVTAGKTRDNGIIVGAGEHEGMLITNCIVDGVTLKDGDVSSSTGGIAGRFTSGTISNCLVINCNITTKGTVGGICGWRGTITDCAVINTTLASGWDISNREVSIGWSDNSTVKSSYAKVTIASAEKKIMYGDSTAWANWTYNSMLNGGYPVQTTLFHIGGFSGSANVYNYLRNTLGFTVA